MTWRKSKKDEYAHIHLFDDEDWGLIIYDEVHLLPAPVFTRTASLQGRRRLGLTATLIREDGREGDVFSLVGPKVYELPWSIFLNFKSASNKLNTNATEWMKKSQIRNGT